MEQDFLMDNNQDNYSTKQKTSPWGRFLILLVVLLATSFYVLNTAKEAPANFPINTLFSVKIGDSVMTVAEAAKANNLTKSKWLLYSVIRIKYKETGVIASDYKFEKPLNVFELAESFSLGDHDSTLLTLTIPEGSSLKDIARAAKLILSDFDEDEFLKIAVGQEGFLFPETYHIPPTYNEEDLYNLLNTTFSDKVQTLEPDLSNHSLTLTEIVILASIIEREANSIESMRMVSGILQERLQIGMALQVDATMEYVLEKPLSELTAEDLKMESPYNTYLNAGLPPTPIGNPGLESIKAVLYPTPSDYLFYITGDDGVFYYARNFDEHRQNIERYLR